MTAEPTLYTVRPDGTALWLPAILAESLGIHYGDRLTGEQMACEDIAGLIARRLAAEKGRKK